jgi:hypothetical protein
MLCPATVLVDAVPGAGSGLVGQWHFDTTQFTPRTDLLETLDSSGNGLDATLTGTTLVPGRFDNALEFTGANLSEAVVQGPEPALQPEDVTVLAWVRRSGSPGEFRYVMADGARACSAASYALETGSGGGLVFYVDEGPAVHMSPDAGTSVWDGNWHMVAGTFDGLTVRLYVDGAQVGTGTAAATTIDYGAATTSSAFVIGDYPGAAGCGSSFQWAGDLDEARVYSRALTADEIGYLGTAATPGPPALPAPTSTTTAPATATSIAPTSATTTPRTLLPTSTSPATTSVPRAGRPVPILRTVPAGDTRQAVFDSSGTKANGSPIERFDYAVKAGGRRYQLSCGAGSPELTLNFSGTAVGEVALTAEAAGGAKASTGAIAFAARASRSAAGGAIGGGRLAPEVFSSGVITSYVCSSGLLGQLRQRASATSCALFTHLCSDFCPSALSSVRVITGILDAEMCAAVQADNPDLLPAPEAGILAKYLRTPATGDNGGDTFYVTYGTARVNGLIVKPGPGAAIVVAVAGGDNANFLHANTAFLVSRNATIYFTTNGSTQTGADLHVSPTTAVALNWSSHITGNFNSVISPGGEVNLDVGAVPYCVYEGSCPSSTRTAVPVASLDVLHLDNGLSFPGIPIKGVGLTGTLGVELDADKAHPHPYSTLTNASLTIPLSSCAAPCTGGSITGEINVISDNDSGTYLDKLQFSFQRGDSGFLSDIPLENLSLSYYHNKGPDTDDAANTHPSGPEHPAGALVGAAQVQLPAPLSGTLSGRLVITPGTGWSFVVDLETQIQLSPDPAPTYLTHALLSYDSTTGWLHGEARIAALWSTGDGGCGVAGVNGDVDIRFEPQFDIHADGQSELMCLPMGSSSTFDLYATQNPAGVAVNLGGGVTYDLGDVLKFNGQVQGGFFVGDDGQWHVQVDGQETGTANVGPVSGGFTGEVVASDAGMGICAGAEEDINVLGFDFHGTIHPGFGFHFQGKRDFIATMTPVAAAAASGQEEVAAAILGARFVFGDYKTGDSCNIDQFRSIHGNLAPPTPPTAGRRDAGVAASSSQAKFTLPAGDGTAIVQLSASRGVPRFVLRGPGDREVDGTKGITSGGRNYLVLTAPARHQALVYLAAPNAGTWTVAAAAGSPVIRDVEVSRQLPNPSATATLSGSGRHRALQFNIRNLPRGTKLTFVERGPTGGYVTLGHSSTTAGTIDFTPAELRAGTDEVLALPEGPTAAPLPAVRLARFTSTPPAIGRAGSVRATLQGRALRVTFRPAPGVPKQLVLVRLSDGERLLVRVATGSAAFTLPRTSGSRRIVVISVRGVRDGTYGPLVTYLPTAKAPR